MIELEEIGRLPAPGDNSAIASRTLAAGTAVHYDGGRFILSHTVLEGHRFAVRPITAGQPLLSWGYPFGKALTAIAPGDYLCNEAVLVELWSRALELVLPAAPNFADYAAPYTFDAAHFQPAAPLSRYPEALTFQGYPRAGGRGTGTRNIIVLLATSSLAGAFVRQLEGRLRPLAADYAHLDDIVAVAHTEGGGRPGNNQALLLRTLAGFMVHPNVGAVLAVDSEAASIHNAMLRDYLAEHNYPLEAVPHQFFSLSAAFADDLERAAGIVQKWLDEVNSSPRTAVPLSQLKIGLQCGGSDAFSGVSGNPLAAWVAKEVLHYGGSANLAETDELVGAEAYALAKVRDAATAQRFLHTLARFQQWAGWHGHSAAGNPSGGNLYRGLYNIYLKSIGAATKRHPEVPLDFVIDYATPMTEAGYYFMDSPGNDLESVAGQVAAGCNLIFFVTGNGSITNFPFVPTIKIVTTSERYNLLTQEMDVNAGAYLEGTPMAELGREMFDLTLAVAAGRLSAGEKAGHAQVQIWRDWQLTGPTNTVPLEQAAQLDGQPYAVPAADSLPNAYFDGWQTVKGLTSDQVGLILPTSLCAGQIAQLCAQRLNEQAGGQTRFVALPHTEGCGSSTQAEFINTLIGYATHPLVGHCLLLEHGCEKTHNAFWQRQLEQAGIDPAAFGWASIQLDGGIRPVLAKMAGWFNARLEEAEAPMAVAAGLGAVRLGLVTAALPSDDAAAQLAQLTQWIASAGGLVVVPVHDALLGQPAYLEGLSLPPQPAATLAFAQRANQSGLHLMQTPSPHWTETLTGLGATGVEIVVAWAGKRPLPGHPLVPVLQVGEDTAGGSDFDLVLSGHIGLWSQQLLGLVLQTLSRRYVPAVNRQANVDFQITRGVLGVSL
jgi:altronate dehydratase